VTNLSAGFRRRAAAFDGLSFRFTEPGLARLDGRNGAGKSTLIEVISGYLAPLSGSVRVLGHSASSHAARAHRRVCRTRAALFGEMTVHDHLVFASRCAGVDSAQAVARFEAYGGGEWRNARAGELSEGNARKLWLVMSTVGRFGVVALDEPFVGLDDRGSRVLESEIADWRKDALVLLVSHQVPSGLMIDRSVIVGKPSSDGVDDGA
jgi:ABC-type multidrug transport system ATPase subunit